jgi:hypothetical protein
MMKTEFLSKVNTFFVKTSRKGAGMHTKSTKNIAKIDLVHPQWLPEHRKGTEICLIGELGWLLDLLWAPLRAIRVVPHTPWSTKSRLQSFAFGVFDIVSCHVPFCIRFNMIFAWLPGFRNLENCVLVEAKREFLQKWWFGIEHWFLSKSDPQSFRFRHLELVKIAEKCSRNHDRTDWLGKGPCIAESGPKMVLGVQIPEIYPQCASRARATKTAFLNLKLCYNMLLGIRY